MISVSLRNFDAPSHAVPASAERTTEMLHPRDVAALVRLLIVIQRASADASGWEEVSRLFVALSETFTGERLAALRAVREWIDDAEGPAPQSHNAAFRRLPLPRSSGDAVDALREIVAPAVMEAARGGASRESTAAADARLDLCLEHCTQGMMTFSAEGRCLFINRTAVRLLKLPVEPLGHLVDRRILYRPLRRLVDEFIANATPTPQWTTPCALAVSGSRIQCFPLVVTKPAERGTEALLHIFLLAEAGSDDLAERVLRRAHLSKQETLVVRAIFDGKSNAAIARQMNLSVHTVRTYTDRVYEKLDVSNRYELMKLVNSAVDYPLVDDADG